MKMTKKKKLPEEAKRKNTSAKEEMHTVQVNTGKQNLITTRLLPKVLQNHNTGWKQEWFITILKWNVKNHLDSF